MKGEAARAFAAAMVAVLVISTCFWIASVKAAPLWTDTFSDSTPSGYTSRWDTWQFGAGNPTTGSVAVDVGNNRLLITITDGANNTANTCGFGITLKDSILTLQADFVMQVNYEILSWNLANPYCRCALGDTRPVSEDTWMWGERISENPHYGIDSHLNGYHNSVVSDQPTTATSGTIRLQRSGNVVTEYYLDSTVGNWTASGYSDQGTGNLSPELGFWVWYPSGTYSGGSYQIAFSDFEVVSGTPSHAVTITPSSADTTTKHDPNDANSVTTNYGGDTFVEALRYDHQGDQFYQYYGFVMFDVSSSVPSGATIVSAFLELYDTEGAGGDGMTVYAYRVDSNWVETTLTWNTNPTTEGTFTASATYNPSNTGYHSWDVTNDVKAFVSGSANNYGWCLTISDGGWVTFASKEGNNNQYPKLVVTWTPSADPSVARARATDDSYVSTYHEDDPGTNFGTATFLRVSNYGDDVMYVFLTFDLSTIPAGSTIVSADLKLYARYGSGDFNIETYRVVGDWDETTITWNNMPSIASPYTYSCGAPTTDSWATFDVKSDVQLFVSGSTPNYGWCLTIDAQGNGYYGNRLFDSKEYPNPNTWPVLEVTYVVRAPARVGLNTPAINGKTIDINGYAIPGDNVTEIDWNWGDGTGVEQHFFPNSHTYASGGTYTVTVTAHYEDEGGTFTASESVDVTVGEGIKSGGWSLTIENSGGGSVSYHSSLGDGTVPSGDSIELYLADGDPVWGIEATPDEGYNFGLWTVSGTNIPFMNGYNQTSNPVAILVSSDGTITANFARAIAKLYIVHVGLTDNMFWGSADTDTTSFSGWTMLPGQTDLGVAAAVSDGKLYLVHVGIDNDMFWGSVNLADKTFSGWNILPGKTSVSVAAAVSNGELCIVHVGWTHEMFWGSVNLTDSTFSGWNILPGMTDYSVAAAVSDGKLYLVHVGMTLQMFWGSVNLAGKTFSGWNVLPGMTAMSASVAAYDGKLYLAHVGMGNDMFWGCVNLTDSTFSGWNMVPGMTLLPVAVTFWGEFYLVHVGYTSDVFWGSVNPSGPSFSGWTVLPGKTSLSVAATAADATS